MTIDVSSLLEELTQRRKERDNAVDVAMVTIVAFFEDEAIGGWLRQTDSLLVAKEAGLLVDGSGDNIVVVLAEEKLGAISRIGDASERSRLRLFGGRFACIRWEKALKNLSRRGVEDNDRLRRTHQQHGAAMGGAVRIERNGLGAHG